jgi:hypothetical protein
VNQQLFHFFIAKDYILLNVETHLMEAGRIEQFNKSKRTISVQTPPIQGRPAVKEKITGSERPNYSPIPHGA